MGMAKRTGLSIALALLLLAPAAPGIFWLAASRAGEASAVAEQTVLLEAEDLEGEWNQQTNIPGYSGRGFRVSNARGVATSTLRGELTVTQPGRFAVWARGYVGDGLDRSFSLAVGGQKLPPTHRERGLERFRWQLAGCVELEAGSHGVVVRDRGDGFEVVDALLFTDDLDFDPGLRDRLEARLFAQGGDPDGEDEVDLLIARAAGSAEAADREFRRRVAEAAPDQDRLRGEQEQLRRRLREALGLEPLPPRTPLRARTLGVARRAGYSIERIVFESRPGFPVPANVYVPERPAATTSTSGAPRFPAVLCPVGHWAHAKSQPQVQARCIGLAKLGFIAITYDPFGQGERSVAGNSHQEYFHSVLVGRNNMTYMVWDTLRALDYLLERGDVDPERIACTGASGGGLNTFYAAAIDERIRAAAPVVFVSRLREFLETRIRHCPCSHVNGLASFADEGTVLALVAPRPLLLVTATDDPMFTPEGARNALEQALSTYRAFGAGDALSVLEFPGGHDYSRPMREAVYGWVRRHLGGEADGSPIPEPEMELEPVDSSALRCFPAGRVPAHAETVRSLNLIEARRLVSLRANAEDRGEGLEPLRRLLDWPARGGHAVEEIPLEPSLIERYREVAPSAPEPVILRAAGQRLLRGHRWPARSPAPQRRVIVATTRDPARLLHAGMASRRKPPPGVETVVIDLRGDVGRRHLHLLATDSQLLGEPLLARRASDLAAIPAALALGDPSGDSPSTFLAAADAHASLAVLLAQALESPARGLVLAGLSDSPLAPIEGDLDPDAAVWRFLAAANVRELVKQVDVPLVLLPGGSALAAMVEALPPAEGE